MKRIKTTQLVPGMRLAEDIILPKTNVTLIGAGTELSIEAIRRIENLGIEAVGIDETKRTVRMRRNGNSFRFWLKTMNGRLLQWRK